MFDLSFPYKRCLIAPMEHPDALITMHKNQNKLIPTFVGKIRLDRQMGEKNGPFWLFFLIFFKTVHVHKPI